MIARVGVTTIINKQRNMSVIAEAADGMEAVAMYRMHKPDVTLMDMRMPILSGLEATAAIRGEFPNARIIALTSYGGDADVRRALKTGVMAYLTKDLLQDELLTAIREVHQGHSYLPAALAAVLTMQGSQPELTQRELEVLELVVRGMANKQIAYSLHLSELTVKNHLKRLLDKLGVQDRTQAATAAIARGIVHLGKSAIASGPPPRRQDVSVPGGLWSRRGIRGLASALLWENRRDHTLRGGAYGNRSHYLQRFDVDRGGRLRARVGDVQGSVGREGQPVRQHSGVYSANQLEVREGEPVDRFGDFAGAPHALAIGSHRQTVRRRAANERDRTEFRSGIIDPFHFFPLVEIHHGKTVMSGEVDQDLVGRAVGLGGEGHGPDAASHLQFPCDRLGLLVDDRQGSI